MKKNIDTAPCQCFLHKLISNCYNSKVWKVYGLMTSHQGRISRAFGSRVPEGLVKSVVYFLNTKDLMVVSGVNKSWEKLISEIDSWKYIFHERHWLTESPESGKWLMFNPEAGIWTLKRNVQHGAVMKTIHRNEEKKKRVKARLAKMSLYSEFDSHNNDLFTCVRTLFVEAAFHTCVIFHLFGEFLSGRFPVPKNLIITLLVLQTIIALVGIIVIATQITILLSEQAFFIGIDNYISNLIISYKEYKPGARLSDTLRAVDIDDLIFLEIVTIVGDSLTFIIPPLFSYLIYIDQPVWLALVPVLILAISKITYLRAIDRNLSYKVKHLTFVGI